MERSSRSMVIKQIEVNISQVLVLVRRAKKLADSDFEGFMNCLVRHITIQGFPFKA